jgi:hypothetical protein
MAHAAIDKGLGGFLPLGNGKAQSLRRHQATLKAIIIKALGVEQMIAKQPRKFLVAMARGPQGRLGWKTAGPVRSQYRPGVKVTKE